MPTSHNKKGAAPITTLAPQNSSHDYTPLAVSMRDAARLLSVSERSVWSLVHSGKLPSIRIGRSVRIPMDALREYVGGAR